MIMGVGVATGKVYLVGAGPGDPGLFTLRGKEVLGEAEVVIYDYLANEELLAFAPREAEKIYVGKKGGDHTLSQEAINRLMVEKGRDQVVVRLKGGDPFVFGRGGEEAEELVAAGIPFEVVPGVTAAAAVPAYAGIPLSHRDLTASVAFVTGHERADRDDSKIAWEKLAGAVGTLVFFMGVKNLPEIVRQLTAHGRPASTPVAVIRWGTMPEQRTVTGCLEDIVERVKAADLKPPAIVVVGDVVKLREKLNWFESRPLFGRTVVVTRAREQASGFKRLLQDLGARCVEFPTIAIEPPESWAPLDRAVSRVGSYDWVLFTSLNGVRCFMERLTAGGGDVRDLKGVRLGAIGPKTAEALEAFGLRLDLVPGEYRAEAILDVLQGEDLVGRRFLLPRAAAARDVLPETLKRRGAEVDVVPAYRTVLPAEKSGKIMKLLHEGEIHCITFTSSSTVGHFFSLLKPHDVRPLLKDVVLACIGPITADTLRTFGWEPTVTAEEYTVPGLVRAICDHFSRVRENRGPAAQAAGKKET